MGATTLAIIWAVTDRHGAGLGRTMGLTTFSFANLFFSFSMKDKTRSIFDFEQFFDQKFLIASAASFVAILIAPELRICQRILHTEDLSLRQWLLCLGTGLVTIAVPEIQKLLARCRAA